MAICIGAIIKTAGAAFLKQMDQVGTALNTVGAEVNFVSGQMSYNSDKIDALNNRSWIAS